MNTENIMRPNLNDGSQSLDVRRIINNKNELNIYKHALLDSGAELTITNDLSLFFQDTMEYPDKV
jgi:hypothetical protein